MRPIHLILIDAILALISLCGCTIQPQIKPDVHVTIFPRPLRPRLRAENPWAVTEGPAVVAVVSVPTVLHDGTTSNPVSKEIQHDARGQFILRKGAKHYWIPSSQKWTATIRSCGPRGCTSRLSEIGVGQ